MSIVSNSANMPPSAAPRSSGNVDAATVSDNPELLAQQGSASIDTTTALKQLADSMEFLFNSLVGLQPGSGSNAEPSPPGAPALEPPRVPLSSADLSLEINALMKTFSDGQIKFASEGTKLSGVQKTEAHERAIAKIEEIARKMAEAAKKEKAMGILGIFAKVFSAIAAVALTAVTAGAAAPIAAALLVYTIVDTTLTVADAVSNAAGGPRLGLDTLLSKGFEEMAKSMGASDDKAKEIGQWTAFAIQAAIAIAGIACGAGAAKAIANGAEMAMKMSVETLKAVRIVQIAAQVTNGLVLASKGGVTIAKGFDDKAAGDAKATQLDMERIMMMLQALMDMNLEQVKDAVEASATGDKVASDVMKKGHDSSMATVHNVV